MAASNQRLLLAIFSLYLSSTTLGGNSLTIRWGHQIVTPTKDSIFGTMVADSNDGIYIIDTVVAGTITCFAYLSILLRDYFA